MNVLYDHQTFALQDFGGISRIFKELLSHASASTNINAEVSILLSNNSYLRELESVKYLSFFPNYSSHYKVRLMMEINKQRSISKLKDNQFDVFHPTYYDPYFLKYLNKKPFVVTFFDLIHERFKSRYSSLADDKFMHERQRILLEHSAKVIAISECTKNDIIQYFGTDSNKIQVISLGNSLQVMEDSAPVKMINEHYLLFVGNRGMYKNFAFTVNSIRDILVTEKDLKFICAGGNTFSKEEINLFHKLEIADKVMHIPVLNDATLISLYSHAECFIFPSLYEGFGIPVLEAFACGCPIVLSDRASLPEVAGEAAVYCNPEDASSIFNAVNLFLNNKELRQQKSREGKQRLALFSWKKTSEATFKLYQSLV